MTILLVDDERPAIDALCHTVDWEALGFSRVETAYNAAQAKQILEITPVAVLLCDIEMPGGSGLTLLQWAHVYRPATVNILFTCHADFNYARQAVALGAFDYILKPSTMEAVAETVARAAEEWKRRREAEQREGQWERNKDVILERFWLEVITGDRPKNRDSLQKSIVRQGLDTDVFASYTLILCAVKWIGTCDWNPADLDYAFRNVLTELFTFGQAPVIVSESSKRKLLLLPESGVGQLDMEQRFQQFFDLVQPHFRAGICFYVGTSVPPEMLSAEYHRLGELERQNVSSSSHVYYSGNPMDPELPAEMGNMARWQQILEAGNAGPLCKEVNEWLDHQVNWGRMNARYLELFYHEFLQMLYTVLSQHHISAVQLLREQPEEAACALDSLEAVKTHLEWMIRRSCDYLRSVSHQNELIKRVTDYIQDHLSENLSRDLLASEVYLNPNYLSRLFHQEVGCSLVDYITQQRIERVKQLLRNTNLSVTAVAGQFGYTNMPYFSRVFRKEAGCSPVEYRRRFHTDEK